MPIKQKIKKNPPLEDLLVGCLWLHLGNVHHLVQDVQHRAEHCTGESCQQSQLRQIFLIINFKWVQSLKNYKHFFLVIYSYLLFYFCSSRAHFQLYDTTTSYAGACEFAFPRPASNPLSLQSLADPDLARVASFCQVRIRNIPLRNKSKSRLLPWGFKISVQ
jgi:hypothetical protein